MPYVVQAKIVHNHAVPVRLFELRRYMSCYIIINLSKVLVIPYLALCIAI